ncbi:DUF805 domain-containing protein [Myroides sp. LJL115]
MIKQYVETIKKHYIDFDGRASRRNYWTFVLISFLISIPLAIVDYLIGFKLFGSLFSLALFLPSLGYIVRRLHDTNKSPWWLLLCLTGIGSIVVFVFLLLKSDEYANQYGEPDRHVDIKL